MIQRTFLVTLILFFSTACQLDNSTPTQSPISKEQRELTEAEAVRLAEDFIQNNGYTDLPPITDRSKISFEHIEWESDIEELLEHRYDTLERKAYGVDSYSRRAARGWTVVFRHRSNNTESGRAVTMNIYGENLLVEHVDHFLNMVDRKL